MRTAVTVYEIDCPTYAREHPEAEDVDLEQAERIEVVLVPLDHGALGHRRVFHRDQAREAAVVDDKAAGMLREVAREADELLGEIDHLLHDLVGDVESRLLE